jgi:hypothetical protein
VVRRLARNLVLACLALAVTALVWAPDRPRVAFGVVGGGVLSALALWVIAGAVGGWARRAESGEIRPKTRGFALVNFFTRHVILALVAYVMMVRLHLDPVGMLIGVTSVVVAVAVEAARPR